MKVKELKSDGLKREYNVVVDAAALNSRVESRLKNMAGRVKIPGFRPGHVPMNILQQRYGKSVMGEVLEQAVKQSTQDLVKEKNIRPALQPAVKITDYQEGGDLSFDVTIELFPKIPEMDFGKISLEKLTYDIDEKEVEESLNRLAERNKSLNKRDKSAKAKQGDVVVIDFKGSVDGVAFEGGEAKKFHLELGSNQFIEGFEEQLVGTKAGDDVTVKVTFPKDYHKEDLAGQKAEFAVHVHEVLEVKSPDITDDFAKTMGVADLKALKDALRDQMTKEYDSVARTKLKKQLFDYLEANCTFDVPQGMVDMEFESIWQRLQEAKKQGDPSLDKPDDQLRTEYRRIAERRVRLGLYLAEIGNINKLSVNKDELTQAVMNQARMFPGQEKKVFEFYRNNPEQVEDLRGPILEDKAVDHILGKVKLKERKVPLDELLDMEEEGSEGGDSKKKKAAGKKEEAKTTKKKK